MCRRCVAKGIAGVEMRRRSPLIAAMMVYLGDADGMICGTVGTYGNHLRFIDEVLGKEPGVHTYGAMNILLLGERTVALADTHVTDNHPAREVGEITVAG